MIVHIDSINVLRVMVFDSFIPIANQFRGSVYGDGVDSFVWMEYGVAGDAGGRLLRETGGGESAERDESKGG